MKKNKQKLINNKGFTILEMVIVASVIMIGVMSVVTLVERTLKFRSINQKYLIGVQLAQEGLELTRYIRNDNWMVVTMPSQNENIDFDEAINDSLGANNHSKLFAIDYRVSENTANRLNTGKPRDLYIKTSINNNIFVPIEFDKELKTEESRLYLKDGKSYVINDGSGNTGSVATPFHRLIKTIYHKNDVANNNDDYIEVISKVYWEDRGKDYYYGVATFLYDYDQYF